MRRNIISSSSSGDDRSQKRRDEHTNDSEDSLPDLTIDMGSTDSAAVVPSEPRNGKNLGEA